MELPTQDIMRTPSFSSSKCVPFSAAFLISPDQSQPENSLSQDAHLKTPINKKYNKLIIKYHRYSKKKDKNLPWSELFFHSTSLLLSIHSCATYQESCGTIVNFIQKKTRNSYCCYKSLKTSDNICYIVINKHACTHHYLSDSISSIPHIPTLQV